MNEQLKPFQQVLVRNENDHEWTCDIYSNYEDEYGGFYICTARKRWKQCIPYKGNEALLGTTNAPKPKGWRAKEGETYWFVNSNGVCIDVHENREKFDDYCHDFGNYFRTEEEAKAMADRFRAILKGGNK